MFGDCDPSKNRKPKCPVMRCKQILTFSNTNTCKICNQKVCLKHRFPADHACKQAASFLAATHSRGSPPNPIKFLVALIILFCKYIDCND
uniref:AN1-type domain-containing protein n=1 Tax=Nelumbo nucifera TaxID=4432 RepID=A0A822Z622_NELNU|nr:TPA_asm: hypothetical protein HUJ06_013444 [Nelumbo nucifera]